MIQILIRKNMYADSIFLMNATRKIMELPNVSNAVLVMGTEMNKTVLKEFGTQQDDYASATANDLVIALDAEGAETTAQASDLLNQLLQEKVGGKSEENLAFPTLGTALTHALDSNLVFISVPGEFAAAEAMNALSKNKSVFIFSDNVPLEEEVALKNLAKEKGLWVMGPGCGTGVMNGISVGMMSKISKGSIGIVGASGSGIHEIAALIDQAGQGITQAIGTGGRDLSREVGAVTMSQGLQYLMDDEQTKVIVLISKPPHPDSAAKIYKLLHECKKPVVIYFLGKDLPKPEAACVRLAATLEDAADIAVRLVQGKDIRQGDVLSEYQEELRAVLPHAGEGLSTQQRYVRGLYCGGTHSEEAILLLSSLVEPVHANISFGGSVLLTDVRKSIGHCLVDMGDEEFTRGRPHPVMEPSVLCDRLLQEADDPEVAVILFDLLLGYGAHADPVGEITGTLEEINVRLKTQGRRISLIASLCGTDLDPQGFQNQKERLEMLGVKVFSSNARAVLLAGLVALQQEVTK